MALTRRDQHAGSGVGWKIVVVVKILAFALCIKNNMIEAVDMLAECCTAADRTILVDCGMEKYWTIIIVSGINPTKLGQNVTFFDSHITLHRSLSYNK